MHFRLILVKFRELLFNTVPNVLSFIILFLKRVKIKYNMFTHIEGET